MPVEKPILLYGSDIWGTSFKTKNMFNFKNKIESVQLKCCRYILGVSWNCSSIGILGELGRLPMSYHVILNAVKYWSHLKSTQDCKNTLTCKTLNHMETYKHSTWLNNVTKCLSDLELDIKDIQLTNSKLKRNFIDNVKQKLENHCKSQWKIKIPRGTRPNTNSKLRTYITFKKDFESEAYLTSNLSLQDKTMFAKLRLSNSDLEIEKGRSRNIPLDNRICKHCKSGEIEDEFHFVMSCQLFDTFRNELFQTILKHDHAFSTLSPKDRFIYIMSYKSNLADIALFLNRCMTKRKVY